MGGGCLAGGKETHSHASGRDMGREPNSLKNVWPLPGQVGLSLSATFAHRGPRGEKDKWWDFCADCVVDSPQSELISLRCGISMQTSEL